MKRLSKPPRAAASDGMVALRKALNMTQAEFAVLVLKTAVTTIARYETTHPPEGDLICRLEQIAEEHNLFELRDRFRELYAEEVLSKLAFTILMRPKSDEEREHAYLFTRVNGRDAILLAQYFLTVAEALNSEVQGERESALDALGAMQKAADFINANPVHAKLTRALADVMANPATTQQQPPATTANPRKKRR